MGKVLDFRKEEKGSSEEQDLNHFIREALKKKSKRLEKGKPLVFSDSDFKELLYEEIARGIVEQEELSSQTFLCGQYVVQIIFDAAYNVPYSWYAVDFLREYREQNIPLYLKEGGDMCFILCTIFPKRCEFRQMNFSYYKNMGESLYYQYYVSAGEEIGYMMSVNFNPLVEIVQNCLQELE